MEDRLSSSQMAQLQLKQRRSSIMQQAKKDGVLPDMRGSVGSTGGTGSAGPTPVARPGQGRGGGTSAPSSQRTGLLRKATSNASVNRVAAARQASGQKGRSTVGGSAKSHLPMKTRAANSTVSSASTLTAKKRQMSTSLSDIFKTPGSCFKTPEPRSTVSRWGSQGSLAGGREREGKGLKIPGTRDYKQMSEITQSVHGLLLSFGVEGIPAAPNDLKNITTQKFYNICAVVGERFVGRKYFETEDIVTALVDMSRLLEYPGSISKSHLKSATSQHSWPQCLVYLTWLCHRYAAACADDSSDDDRMYFDEGFPFQIATPSYRRLYFTHENNPGDYEGAVVREMNQFNQKVSDQLLGEVRQSVEELQVSKAEVEAELAAVRETPDATKNTLESLRSIDEQIAAIEASKTKMKAQRTFFKNTHSLVAQTTSLRMDINAVHIEIEALQAKIEEQPFDMATSIELQKETEKCAKTREYYTSLHQKIQADVDAKQAEDAELEATYLQVLTEFSVVERYNATLKDIKVNQLTVSPNPIETAAMEKWLKNVEKAQQQTEQLALKYVDALNGNITELSESYKMAEKQLNDLKRTLTTKQSYVKHGKSQLKAEEQNLKAECNELESKLASKKAIAEAIQAKILEAERKILSITEGLNKLRQSTKNAEDEMAHIEKEVEIVVDACKSELIEAKNDALKKIHEVVGKNKKLVDDAEIFVKSLELKYPELFVDNCFWKLVREDELEGASTDNSTAEPTLSVDPEETLPNQAIITVDMSLGDNSTAATELVQELSGLNIEPSFPGSSST